MELVSAVDHDNSTCVHEYNVRSGTCTFTDMDGEKCHRRTKSQKEPPRCSWHYRKKGLVGSCQAIEECGFRCNRLAIHDPPFHLCTKHEKGCSTLPCHFNKLPMELIMLIFEFCLPNVVHPKEDSSKSNVAVLEINKLSHDAGYKVLYGQCIFRVHIDMDGIYFLKRRLDVKIGDKFEYNEYLAPDASQAFWSVLRRIAHLEVIVTLEHDDEELMIYRTRQSVRKLVSLISSSQYNEKVSIRELSVVPKVSRMWDWKVEWLTAVFVVIEPFQLLQLNFARLDFQTLADDSEVPLPYVPRFWRSGRDVVTDARTNEIYERERSRWLKYLQSPSSNVPQRPVNIERLFDKMCIMIGEFDSVASKEERRNRFPLGSRDKYVGDLEMADMACENGDLQLLKNIRKVIACKWVEGMQTTQGKMLSVGGAFSDMYDTGEAEKDICEIDKYLNGPYECDCPRLPVCLQLPECLRLARYTANLSANS